jgi:hypothetical protein
MLPSAGHRWRPIICCRKLLYESKHKLARSLAPLCLTKRDLTVNSNCSRKDDFDDYELGRGGYAGRPVRDVERKRNLDHGTLGQYNLSGHRTGAMASVKMQTLFLQMRPKGLNRGHITT